MIVAMSLSAAMFIYSSTIVYEQRQALTFAWTRSDIIVHLVNALFGDCPLLKDVGSVVLLQCRITFAFCVCCVQSCRCLRSGPETESKRWF